jgi:hypothetical protein
LKRPVEIEAALEGELDDAAGTSKPLMSTAEGVDDVFSLCD